MKEKLLNNLWLKIASLILAFVVWMAIVNISNPIISGEQTVPVDVLNGKVLEDANLSYELGKTSVIVSYDVRTRDRSLIRGSDFRAYIDLKDYSVTGAVPVYVVVNKDKESLIKSDTVSSKSPVIRIATEEIQRKPFTLLVETKGEPEDGYALGLITLSPDTVTVEGPQSQIGKIHHMGVELDINNASADLSGNVEPKFYDANSNELTRSELGDKITLSREEIGYNIAVLKAKSLALSFDIKGIVADGYRFTGVECETKSVSVVGTKSVLASITTLSIADDKLSINGATSDKVVHLDLRNYLPPNTSFVGDEHNEVAVTLKIEPLTTQSFAMDLNDIAKQGIIADYEYSFSRDSVVVIVKGLKEDLETLTAADLNAVMNLTDLEPGEHPGDLIFEVSEGFEIVTYTDFEVTITSEEEEEPSTNETDSSKPETETKAKEANAKETTAKETTVSDD